MKHLILDARQVKQFQKLLPCLHLYIKEYAQKDLPIGKARRTGIGNAVESVYHAVLRVRYTEAQLEFEDNKTMLQMMHGPDGVPDAGYDIRLKGLTYDYRIDCKWQECLKYGNVDLGLFYASGNTQFALSGKATHSAHFYFEYRPAEPALKALLNKLNRPIPKEYTLRAVFVDLERFRQLIQKVDGQYTAGPHVEHRAAVSNDRMIQVSVKWLEENDCAISYTIEA